MAAGDEDRDQRERRFRRLYEANFHPVQAYAVNRLGRCDDVADVVAEVFMIAWRRLADIPPPPSDRFWLYGTARRVLSRRYRSASRWHRLLGRLAAEEWPKVQALERADNPAQERLLAAIGELKPAYREALLLVHWEQLTYAEAAQALGCSANAVSMRVHRAKERLRTLLGAESRADRSVPAATKPNGVTDGS